MNLQRVNDDFTKAISQAFDEVGLEAIREFVEDLKAGIAKKGEPLTHYEVMMEINRQLGNYERAERLKGITIEEPTEEVE